MTMEVLTSALVLAGVISWLVWFLASHLAYQRGYKRGAKHGHALATIQATGARLVELSTEHEAARALLTQLGYLWRDGGWRYDYTSIGATGAQTPEDVAKTNEHFTKLQHAVSKLEALGYSWHGEWLAPPKPERDRERDRQQFTDTEFNKWLDAGVTENGEHTVWHMLTDTLDAYRGWQEGMQAGRNYCPSCMGSGEGIALVGGGPDAHEEPCVCATCKGTGGIDGALLDVTRLDWLQEASRSSRTGVGFDYHPTGLERGYRGMRYHEIGDRKPTLREAIDAMRGVA